MTHAAQYLLDTTALIDFSKRFEPARSKILELIDTGHQLAVCCVTAAEFLDCVPWRGRRRSRIWRAATRSARRTWRRRSSTSPAAASSLGGALFVPASLV